MTPMLVAQTLVAQIFIATLMTSMKSMEIDEIDEFDELDEFDECDEFDELGISFIGRAVHGAMLKNFLFQMLKRPSAYQNLIYFRTYSEDHHHILDLLEKRPHFALV